MLHVGLILAARILDANPSGRKLRERVKADRPRGRNCDGVGTEPAGFGTLPQWAHWNDFGFAGDWFPGSSTVGATLLRLAMAPAEEDWLTLSAAAPCWRRFNILLRPLRFDAKYGRSRRSDLTSLLRNIHHLDWSAACAPSGPVAYRAAPPVSGGRAFRRGACRPWCRRRLLSES